MRNTILALLLLPALACSKDTDDGKRPECDADHPCSAGQVCLPNEGRCVPLPLADLTMPPPADMKKDEPDLTMPACTGMKYQFASSALMLPGGGQRFAVDFDGDTRADNQFGEITAAVNLVGLDMQPPVTEAVRGGQLVALLGLEAPSLRDTDCAALGLNTAVPRGPGDPRPRYDGTDRFMVPLGQATTQLTGAIQAGQMETTRPPKLPEDAPRLELRLPLLGAVLPLTLHGVHVQGAVLAGGIMRGELHGVIHQQDIDGRIIPAIADLLTQTIRADPNSATTNQLVMLFEDPAGNAASRMKCMVAADCCQKPENRPTCKITPAEVKSNALVGRFLAPDVQVFAGTKWKPVAGGRDKNGLSVGLGFTAVPATF